MVLDLNGHRLGNLAAGSGTTANGIHAVDRKNLTIKNGTVRGFEIGILLSDSSADNTRTFTTSQGHVIEDIRADLNTFEGIEVQGRGNLIRNTQVVATGGTTVVGTNGTAVGISVFGLENRVLNNDVIDTFGTTTCGGCTGNSFGIFFAFTTNALAVNNRITQATDGIVYGTGSTGKFRDNLTSGVTFPFTGGTDAGGNN